MIEHADGMLRITIPAAMQSFAVVFLLFWLCFWPLGEIKAVRDLCGRSEDGQLFTIIFEICPGGAGQAGEVAMRGDCEAPTKRRDL